MAKDWWIKLEVGAWQRDVDVLSIEAEGALLKITFKLDSAPVKGRFDFAFDSLCKMFKKDAENTRRIVDELKRNDILNITYLPDDIIRIESRRLLKQAHTALKNSMNGKKGGRGKKRNESETKANTNPNESETLTINSYSNSDFDFSEKGGAGGKGQIEILRTDEAFAASVQHRFGVSAEEYTRIFEHFTRSRITKAIQHETQTQARADFENYIDTWIHNQKVPGNGITTIKGDDRNPRKDVSDYYKNQEA